MLSLSLIHKLLIKQSIRLANISTDCVSLTRGCDGQFDTRILLLGPGLHYYLFGYRIIATRLHEDAK